MTEKYIVFSIDDQSIEGRTRFAGWFSGMYREGMVEGALVPLIGKYKGEPEFSYICMTSNWPEIVSAGFADKQESVMLVTECNKQYAKLVYVDGRVEPLGCVCEITEDEAGELDNWTWNPATNKYFTTKFENPDRLPEPTTGMPDMWIEGVRTLLDQIAVHNTLDMKLVNYLREQLGD